LNGGPFFLTESHRDQPVFRYVRVADSLRKRIVDGEYRPGEQLPRQHDLARELGVAFSTLKQALDILEQEGYVVRKVGQGTYASLPEERTAVALVADDEEHIRELFRVSLDQLGWDAVLVRSGEEAVEQVREQGFDIVFIDLLMSGINGSEAFKQIRRIDPEAPVVIVTGYADSNPMQEALLTGPFALMRKPFSISDLRLVLETAGGSLFWMTGKGRSPFSQPQTRDRNRRRSSRAGAR
jgi:CheY-like chemotaxis protein